MGIKPQERIQLADAMTLHYLEVTSYGNRRIDPLSAKLLEFFGKSPISYYPMDPQKKVRDLVSGLSEEELLNLLAYVSNSEPDLEEKINAILRISGFQVTDGKVISGVEHELHLLDEDKSFASFLSSIGLQQHLSLIESALSDLHTSNIHSASSQMCLALDGVLKSVLLLSGTTIPERATLGTLVNLAAGKVIEKDAVQLFQGFVSLRNLRPQHSERDGSVTQISNELAFLLAHSARALIGYLAERIRVLDLKPNL